MDCAPWAAKSETTSIQLDLISSLYAHAAQVAIIRSASA
jgi:hypothetical protein